MKTRVLSIATIIAVMVLLPLAAHANSLHYVDYDATGYAFDRIVDGVFKPANTGTFKGVIYDESGQAVDGGAWFTGFCVEPGMPIHSGDWLPSSVTADEFGNGTGLKAAWLLDTYFYDKTVSNLEIAGLQLAIWEVVKDQDYNLSVGNFQVTSGDQGAQDKANGYLADLQENYNSADIMAKYDVFVDPNKQDLIFRTGDPVPEPSTLLLMGVGLLGLPAIRRKMQQR